MRTGQGIQSTERERVPKYDQQRMVYLFAKSFKISRGAPDIQRAFFAFMASNYRNRLSKGRIDKAASACQHIAEKFIFSSGQHPRIGNASISTEIQQAANIFKHELRDPLDPRDVPNYMNVQDVLRADSRWIPYAGHTYDGAEPDQPYEGSRKPTHYKSYFVHYGLLENTTGSEEVDNFYAAIVREQAAEMVASPHQRAIQLPLLLEGVAAHLSYNPTDTEPLAAVVNRPSGL